jgi:K+/H+ antiporter YhaU regulatory subunit KhtT
MMGDRQSQKSGDSSVNFQAYGDISIGLTYDQTRQVAMDTFKANFVEFQNEAFELVLKRAETLVNVFLDEACKEGLAQISEGKNPDFQYALFSAQREYARSGDEDLGELLVQLLVDRTKVRKRDLEQIVLNESLAVAPKLTPDQLDTLSLIFLVRYTMHSGLNSLDALHTYLDQFILPFVAGASTKRSAYQHLEFAGCTATTAFSTDIHSAITHAYMGLFCEGFTEDELEAVGLSQQVKSQLITPCLHDITRLQVSALNNDLLDEAFEQLSVEREKAESLRQLQSQKVMSPERIRTYLTNVRPQVAQLVEMWENTPMHNTTLTSVGIAVAHANVKRQTGADFGLSQWL